MSKRCESGFPGAKEAPEAPGSCAKSLVNASGPGSAPCRRAMEFFILMLFLCGLATLALYSREARWLAAAAYLEVLGLGGSDSDGL